MRASVRGRRRDQGGSLRHPAWRQTGLARRPRHGGHLRLHLAVEGRCRPPARTATLPDQAQILPRPGRGLDPTGSGAHLGRQAAHARAARVARHETPQKIQAIINQKTTKKIKKPRIVNGSSPKMASPPDTIAITRMTTNETPKAIRAASLSPSPAEKGWPARRT